MTGRTTLSDRHVARRPVCVSPSTPLRLALHPLLPTRTTGHNSWFEYGFQLRLPGGPLIDRTDPLLSAYGARITTMAVHTHDDEQLQEDAFDPGSVVRLVPDAGDDGEPEIGVWDRDELRRAGSLLDRPAAITEVAIEFGLEQTAIVLTEDREADGDRRSSLDLLVFHPAFVEVDTEAALRVHAAVAREAPAPRARGGWEGRRALVGSVGVHRAHRGGCAADVR